MKQFFKTLGFGCWIVFLSAVCVGLIASSIVALFSELLNATGLDAVWCFFAGVFQLVLGIFFIYVLGYIAIKSTEVHND